MSSQSFELLPWLLDHFHAPFVMAQRANAKRQAGYSDQIAVRSWPQDESVPHQLVWEGQKACDDLEPLATQVAMAVNCDTPASRTAFLTWLDHKLQDAPRWSEICVWSLSPSSTQRTWLTACVRILAPATMRVQIPVKTLGLRSTQICLNFGADSLAAPLSASRKLPIAGVASPHDISKLGLATLIEQAGLTPNFFALQETSPA